MSISSHPNFFNVKKRREDKKQMLIVEFSSSFLSYLKIRIRQISFFLYAFFEVLTSVFSNLKAWVIRRMFWGRSSLYRSAFHIMVAVITILAVISGLSQRLNIIASAEYEGLDLSSGILGKQDKFSQLGTAESFGALSQDVKDYPEYIYKVEKDETLASIAAIYQINVNTIKWANSLKTDTLKVGQVLRIPGIDGAMVTVNSGDTLEGIATKYKGNAADILDLNSTVIDANNPILKQGMELFIPNGVIPDPPKKVVKVSTVNYNYSPVKTGGQNVPSGTFVHPLNGEPSCAGWSWSRGFSPWHGGVDFAKRDGCWVDAAGAGTVVKAGWGNSGEGYHVIIEHANGFKTIYYHGNGEFTVQAGEQVQAGQRIMHMGNTGNSTGTHLHFEMRLNGQKVNPENYVQLR
ncbi:MAG: peptidoglycan DD-metalloendopeptidase family protein [bacterium]